MRVVDKVPKDAKGRQRTEERDGWDEKDPLGPVTNPQRPLESYKSTSPYKPTSPQAYHPTNSNVHPTKTACDGRDRPTNPVHH